jgi:hypothetical protein
MTLVRCIGVSRCIGETGRKRIRLGLEMRYWYAVARYSQLQKIG